MEAGSRRRLAFGVPYAQLGGSSQLLAALPQHGCARAEQRAADTPASGTACPRPLLPRAVLWPPLTLTHNHTASAASEPPDGSCMTHERCGCVHPVALSGSLFCSLGGRLPRMRMCTRARARMRAHTRTGPCAYAVQVHARTLPVCAACCRSCCARACAVSNTFAAGSLRLARAVPLSDISGRRLLGPCDCRRAAAQRCDSPARE